MNREFFGDLLVVVVVGVFFLLVSFILRLKAVFQIVEAQI
jgi:uncharacterized membrane protein